MTSAIIKDSQIGCCGQSPLLANSTTQSNGVSDLVGCSAIIIAKQLDQLGLHSWTLRFPVRWENRNTGKSGYAPACANEWVRGVCGKPQVKCGECPNQAFIALSDNAADHRTKQRQIEYVNARNATPRGITGLTRCPSRGAVWSELNIRVWVVLFGSWLPSKSSLFRRYRRLDGPSRFPLG